MIHYWKLSSAIRDRIYIPKYYNPESERQVRKLAKTHNCLSIQKLLDDGILLAETGHEIGKAAYGTGDIPFIRTSDISNWEIKSVPKQGVSLEIYNQFASIQDVKVGDILFVRDGTYLIGTNCFITEIDKDILYQSHIIKFRILDSKALNPHLLFLALNNPWVQRQIRSFQFTADIIDTIGQRFSEIILPIPQNHEYRIKLINECELALNNRMLGKAFIKQCPKILEESLKVGNSETIEKYMSLSAEEKISEASNETVSSEFGSFTSFWRDSSTIINQIFLPSYYDVKITNELNALSEHSELVSIRELVNSGFIEYHTGDEIGKREYNTGDIPFIRTSDFANWEIYHTPKQGISEEVYNKYAASQDIQENDILIVRDGTYLVGSSCIITSKDVKSLFCGGLFKFRVLGGELDPFLFLGIINTYIVKRQFRTKQFTRDVIDTMGNRIDEVILPIPKSVKLRSAISEAIREVISSRISARDEIKKLAEGILSCEGV